MQALFKLVLVALAMLSAAFAFAQDELNLEYIYINNPFDDNFVCSAEEASNFYQALEGFPAQIEAIEDIDSPLKLMLWDRGFSQWFNEAEQTCYGTGNATVALERQARYIAIQHMIGEDAELPEENAYTRAVDMATVDRELMTGDRPVAEDELAINLAVSELPLCTIEEAMAFYATIGDFFVQSIDVGMISDEDQLKEWANAFYTWTEENWTPLLEKPCGQMQSFIDFLDSFAAGTALAQLGIAGDLTLGAFEQIRDILLDLFAEEYAALETYVDA